MRIMGLFEPRCFPLVERVSAKQDCEHWWQLLRATAWEVACYENGPTPTENNQFTARLDGDPIFMQGGAPTAHEVSSECGFCGAIDRSASCRLSPWFGPFGGPVGPQQR
jgi:hypothetical protein